MSLRLLLCSLLVSGCLCSPQMKGDAGEDAGLEEVDSGFDAGAADAGPIDAGLDAGVPDAGPEDPGDGGCRLVAQSLAWSTGRPLAIELADLNADGHPDIIVATTNSLEVRLNDGLGHFGTQSQLGPLTPQTLTLDDVDGDGRLDVISIDVAGRLVVLPGNGDGTFALRAALDAGQAFFVPLEVALGDLDLDGRGEFVTLDVGGSVPELRTVRGGPAGGVPRAQTGSHRLALADVNGDGLLEALVGNAQYGLAVHWGEGDGGFGAPLVFLGSTSVNSLALRDVTGDGVADAICATGFYDLTSGLILGGGVSVLPGTGTDAGFGAPITTASRDIIQAIVVADIDRDGLEDAVITRLAFDGGVEVLGGDAGAFQRIDRVRGGNGWAVAVDDLDGDGKLDVVVGSGAGSSGEVRVLIETCP